MQVRKSAEWDNAWISWAVGGAVMLAVLVLLPMATSATGAEKVAGRVLAPLLVVGGLAAILIVRELRFAANARIGGEMAKVSPEATARSRRSCFIRAWAIGIAAEVVIGVLIGVGIATA